MLSTFSLNMRRVGISRGRIAVIAVIAFLTLTFFAIGYSALEQAEANAAATQQQAGGEGDNAALSMFKFV